MGWHIAVINNSGFGHVIPTLDTVAELVRRGHRVSYVTTGNPVPKVLATGATVLEYDSRLAEVDLATLDNTLEGIWLLVTNLQESERILRAVTDPFLADPPDLILYDVTVYHAGRILARKLGVPAVASSTGLLSNEHFSLLSKMVELAGRRHSRRHPALMQFHHGLLALLAEHGQSDTSIEDFIGQEESLHLAYHPQSFQFAGETFDERFVFVGPGVEDGRSAGDWPPPADDRPLLLVSLGTSSHRRTGFYRICLAAFAELPWHVVVATYDGVDPAELEPLPPNVELHRWVPTFAVLARASAFLCHGGMGSVMTAMVCGTPVLAVPESLEAMANAQRVADLGLGLTLSTAELTAERLRGAVLQVATDPRIRERVQAMRAEIEAAGGGRRGADAIESHLARSLAASAVAPQ